MNTHSNLLQHYHGEEKDFAEKMVDLCQLVERTYAYRVTSFFHQRQAQIATEIAHFYQLQVFSSGDFLSSEYIRLILAPDYYVLDREDFDMAVYRLDYARKFHQLTHSQILGTLLNRLGIKREFLGDIFLTSEDAYVCIDRKFGELLSTEVPKIARVGVTWKMVDVQTLDLIPREATEERQILVSSMRLDKIVAASFRASRSLAVKWITAGLVKVDYIQNEQVSSQLAIGQLVSVRGKGRLRLMEENGYSKQGKIKITVELLRSK